GGFLFGRVEEDDRAVLIAKVRALAVELGGVVVRPEDLEQRVVRHLSGVVGNLDDLRVAGVAVADVLVGRGLEPASHEADGGRLNALDLAKGGLDAPEAA